MKFDTLESSGLASKYFYRSEEWDWITKEMIHVIDSKSPRTITMDYWPQRIFLAGDGQTTVSDFIHEVASKYAQTQIPKNLDEAIINELQSLVHKEKIMMFSNSPQKLDTNLLLPRTEEGEVNMVGKWNGNYDYDLPDKYIDERTQKVEFSIEIFNTEDTTFRGTVEDDLSTGGTPGRGEIKGNYNGYDVTFEKLMPISAMIDAKGNHIIKEKKKHKAIIYQGVFSRDKKNVSGTWRFKKKMLGWYGIIPFWGYPGWGEFTMTKKEV